MWWSTRCRDDEVVNTCRMKSFQQNLKLLGYIQLFTFVWGPMATIYACQSIGPEIPFLWAPLSQ